MIHDLSVLSFVMNGFSSYTIVTQHHIMCPCINASSLRHEHELLLSMSYINPPPPRKYVVPECGCGRLRGGDAGSVVPYCPDRQKVSTPPRTFPCVQSAFQHECHHDMELPSLRHSALRADGGVHPLDAALRIRGDAATHQGEFEAQLADSFLLSAVCRMCGYVRYHSYRHQMRLNTIPPR